MSRVLHDRFGGQRQGGISTPAQSPIVLLFSSPRGADYGYQDGWTAEGLYLYTGEGQRGDMTLARGNGAARQIVVFEANHDLREVMGEIVGATAA